MKNPSFIAFAAAAFAALAFCSCTKDKNTVDFDHFKVEYSIETNLESRDCFVTDYEILINDKVEESGALSIELNGEYTNSDAEPNSTVTFRTVPKYADNIPAEVDLFLKYDITIMAIGKDGGVLDSQSVRGTASSDEKIDLSTAENRKVALDEYTIDFKIKSTVSDGKVVFVPAN